MTRTWVWKWTGNETMHPFWAVRRLSSQQLLKETTPKIPLSFNCELRASQFCVTTIGTLVDSPVAMSSMVQVPILTNTVRLSAGDELLLEVVLAKKSEKKREETWRYEVSRSAKKAKLAPKSSPSKKDQTEI